MLDLQCGTRIGVEDSDLVGARTHSVGSERQRLCGRRRLGDDAGVAATRTSHKSADEDKSDNECRETMCRGSHISPVVN